MALGLYHGLADTSKYFNTPVALHFGPKDALRPILFDTPEYVSRMQDVVPFQCWQYPNSKFAPHETLDHSEIVRRNMTDDLSLRDGTKTQHSADKTDRQKYADRNNLNLAHDV